jgi:GT2 family glycosyltransferase
MTDVTIIIPSYNGRTLLRQNLPAVCLAARTYPGACEVVVVDDASPDDGLDAVRREFPAVRVVELARNLGFSGAIACGVAAATTEVLVFLNSDVQPAADFLAPLVDTLQRDRVFAVSPLILHEDGTPYGISWNRYRFRGGSLRKTDWHLDPGWASGSLGAVPTLYASGGSMAVRKSDFLALDGFAALYRPFYVEDLDLGVRAWRSGWQVLFEPRSRVVHQDAGGAISTHYSRARVKRVQHRNRLLFEWSHFPLSRLVSLSLGHYLIKLLGRFVRGDWAYVTGFAHALGDIPAVIRHRRRLRATAVYDFPTVLGLIEPLENAVSFRAAS